MARRRGDRNPGCQLHRSSVEDVDLVAQQLVDHEPFAVEAVAELIGVADGDVPFDGPVRQIEEQHLVGQGVADYQKTMFGCQRHVVRLPQHRDAPDFLPRDDVDQAD